MKKIIKLLLIVALISAVLIGLTACGDESSKSKKNSNEEAEIESPEDLIKDFVEKVSDGKLSKASKDVDWTKYYYFYSSYGVDYDDFEDVDWKDYEDEYEYSIDYAKSDFEDYKDSIKNLKSFEIKAKDIEVEEIEDTKNLYEVTCNIVGEYKAKKSSDEQEIDEEITFKVIKEKGKYYIVDGISDFKYDVLWDIYYLY